MALFGVKRRKDGGSDKTSSPPQKDLPNGRFENPNNQSPPNQDFNRPAPHNPSPQSVPTQAAQYPTPRSNLGPSPHPIPPNQPNNLSSQPQPTSKPPTPQPSTVIYPWSHRRLGLLPPAPFPGDPSSAQGSAQLRPSPSPFPRYGHSVNAMGTPTGSGDIYIFAGLVKDQVKNDLYVLNVALTPPSNLPGTAAIPPAQLHNQILSVGLVETRGEVPLPRVGHASVGVGNVLIVWGGDTKTNEEEPQDDGLYLLNLSTREWTRVKISGPCPEGRYGHSAAIVGSKFYIFGGQTDNGGFMNDLWSFDLHKLKSGAPKWQSVETAPNDPTPTRRTGHTVVTHGDCIFVFGGTDGQYHYNDTWRFDTTTGQWKELDCIGYIPLPREGHSTTLIDDVMYVLGGRGVDGKDLDDLAAFKISNQRWYMFQNMGPAPAGRSGHAMASWQGKVYVLGGESYTFAKPDDPSIIHVLDTGKIKYPPDPTSAARQQLQAVGNKTSNNSLRSPSHSLNRSVNSLNGPSAMPHPSQPPSQAPRSYPSPASPEHATYADANSARNMKRSTAGPSTNPPPRPRREDDPPLEGSLSMSQRKTMGPTATPPSRTMSPSQSATPSQQGAVSVIMNESSSRRSMSPVVSHNKIPSLDQSMHISPINKAQRPPRAGSVHHILHSHQPSSPSSSPVHRRTSSEAPRGSNNASPPMGTLNNLALSNVHRLQSSTRSSQTDDYQRLQKSNLWMKAALITAVQQGFTLPSSDQEGHEDLADRDWLDNFQPSHNENQTGEKGKDWQRLVGALVQLKHELASAKSQMVDQAKSLDNRVSEIAKTRTAALQEASFYRVKLAAYEAGSITDLNKIERERINDLECKLSEIINTKSGLERQVVQLTHDLDSERNVREMMEENVSKSEERSNDLEALHSRTVIDYEELLNKTRGLDLHATESIERYKTIESSHRAVAADLEESQTKLQASETANEKYLLALEQLQHTLSITNSRVDEIQRFWDQSRADLEQQKSAALDLSRELESRWSELSMANTKVQELEQLLETSKQENAALRALNESGLAELMSITRSQGRQRSESFADGARGQIVEEQAQALKSLHDQTKNKLQATSIELTEVKTRNMALDRELIMCKAEMGRIRSRCSQLTSESNRIKSQISVKEWDLKEKGRLTEAAEVKASLMKNLMAENGLLAADDELGNRSLDSHPVGTTSGGTASTAPGNNLGVNDLGSDQLVKRVRELEQRLEQRSQMHRQLETRHEEAQREMQAAEEKYRDAHRKHEAAADEIASLVQEVQRLRSGGASSVSQASAEGQGKVEEELQVLQERHRSLEQTHIKAVQYVKGTEKMLRRMKDELSKYKDKTESLEAELGEVRKANSTATNEPNMTNELRNQLTELTEQLEHLRKSSKESNLENEELQRRMSSLQAEYEKDMANYEQSAALQLRAVRDELSLVQASNEKLQVELSECVKQNQNLTLMLSQASEHKSDKNSGGNVDETNKQLSTQLTQAQKQIDWLTRENAELQNRCRDAEAKISLLLDHMENQSGTSSPAHDGSNAAGHDPSSRFDWDHKRRSAGLESLVSDYSGYGGVDDPSTKPSPSGNAGPTSQPTAARR